MKIKIYWRVAKVYFEIFFGKFREIVKSRKIRFRMRLMFRENHVRVNLFTCYNVLVHIENGGCGYFLSCGVDITYEVNFSPEWKRRWWIMCVCYGCILLSFFSQDIRYYEMEM